MFEPLLIWNVGVDKQYRISSVMSCERIIVECPFDGEPKFYQIILIVSVSEAVMLEVSTLRPSLLSVTVM